MSGSIFIHTALVSKWVSSSKPIGCKTNRERLTEPLPVCLCVLSGNQKNLNPMVTMKMFWCELSILLKSKVLPNVVLSRFLMTLLKPKL